MAGAGAALSGGIVEYEPGDLTVIVEKPATVASVNAALKAAAEGPMWSLGSWRLTSARTHRLESAICQWYPAGD